MPRLVGSHHQPDLTLESLQSLDDDFARMRYTVRPPSLSSGRNLQRGFIVVAGSMFHVNCIPLVSAVPLASTISATTAESPAVVNAIFNSVTSAGINDRPGQ